MKESTEDKEQTLAILFVDVVESSRLYATYGDAQARDIVGNCLNTLSQVVKEHKGTVIKNLGDEIMCSFPSSSDAAMSAVVMNQRLGEEIGAGSLHSSLSIRTGIHQGNVVLENGDIFGDAVNMAARMASLSKAHQIMVTKDLVDALDGSLRPLARFVDQSTVKGQQGAFDLYEIVWNTTEATMAASGVMPASFNQTERTLTVELGDQRGTVTLEQPVLTMGRSAQCDITIDHNKASRLHARIEYGRGSFALKDVSTNGTYVQLEDTGAQRVRRDEISLTSSGLMQLGEEVDPDSPLCIKLTIRDEAKQL